MLTILIFAAVTFFLAVRLNEILGINVGFKISKERFKEAEKADIREVPELERKLRDVSRGYKKFNTEDFLNKSQKVFEMVFKAYAEEDKGSLKELLAPRTFSAFSMAIDDRRRRRETLEGNLVGFGKVEIIDAEVTKEDIFVTVKFVTEQSNVLKSFDGTILEGSLDFVETRTDVWVFSRKIDSSDPKWFLYEIKSED